MRLCSPLLLTDEPFEGLDLRQSRDVGANPAGARGARALRGRGWSRREEYARSRHVPELATVAQFASARPFNATTGVDNNGDGTISDRPVVNGSVIGRGTAAAGLPNIDTPRMVQFQVRLQF